MTFRLALATLSAALLASASLAIVSAPPAAAVGCPNETIRAEQGKAGLALPDCRAYELASPGSNPFLDTNGQPEGARASTLGGAIAYFTRYPAEGATKSGYRYLATRGASGWSVEELAPQDSPQGSDLFNCGQAFYPSPELSKGILSESWNSEEDVAGEAYCSETEELLAPGAPRGYGNLFLRDTATGSYQFLNLTPESATPANAYLQDATPDFTHVLFSEDARLTPEAPAGFDLFEWAAGALHLVGFLPDGSPVPADLADGSARGNSTGGQQLGLAPVTHAVSPDGERVLFYAQGNLYLRENATQPASAVEEPEPGKFVCTEPAKACTVQVDAVQGGSGTSGGGVFWDASEDGSRVFFADESKLTADSHASTALKHSDLYEYDLEKPLGERLADLTPGAAEAANVRGYSGASEDGSYLYFVARGALTGAQENSQGAKAVALKPNLYLYHEGLTTFIATLDPETDYEDWQETNPANVGETNSGRLTARVSPDGRYLGFGSSNSLTGYENTDVDTGKPDSEVYLYDAGANRLSCASCASGRRPTGATALPEPTGFSSKSIGRPAYLSRNVLDDGRVFFTSPSSLIPADVNGADDVYEYSAGHLYLISSGTASGGSSFYDASPDGKDVFFVTPQSLVRSDTDNGDSLYDAREGGGFSEPPPIPECEAEACRGPRSEPSPSSATTPATPHFEGPGNEKPLVCRKGFHAIVKHGREVCVKKKAQGQKHHKRSHRRAAHTNRRSHR